MFVFFFFYLKVGGEGGNFCIYGAHCNPSLRDDIKAVETGIIWVSFFWRGEACRIEALAEPKRLRQDFTGRSGKINGRGQQRPPTRFNGIPLGDGHPDTGRVLPKAFDISDVTDNALPVSINSRESQGNRERIVSLREQEGKYHKAK